MSGILERGIHKVKEAFWELTLLQLTPFMEECESLRGYYGRKNVLSREKLSRMDPYYASFS